jgi:hypothetical protein
MRMRIFLFTAFLLAACSDGNSTLVTGSDADTGSDANADAARDIGSDTNEDAGAAPDASSDTNADADAATDTDASTIGSYSAVLPAGPCGHAHNDYEHERPLHEALELGFCSVEADVHLVAGSLLVAHDLGDTDPERTLQSLYLGPLRVSLLKTSSGLD